jgi:predicted MFS family arabinose efflux permease
VAGLVAGQLAGVLVDRRDKRQILVVSGILQAFALLPLLLVDGSDRIWVVSVVAAIESCFARLCGPAKAALVPGLVPADRLVAANGLSAVSDNLARLIGSPLGGLAVAVFGLGGVVAVDAMTYLVSSTLIAGIRTPAAAIVAAPEPRATGIRGMVDAWADGIRTIAADSRLAALLLIGALSQLAQGIFVVLFVVFVLERLGGSGGDVGLIRGVQAVGGVLGGVAVARLGRRTEARALIGWGFVIFGTIAVATWNLPIVTTAVAAYAALFVAAGVPGVATSSALLTSVQRLTPPTHLGRVFATFEAGSAILAAVGVLAAGALADRFGVVTILDVQGLIYVACGVLALVLLRELPDAVGRRAPTEAASAPLT